MIVFEGTNGVGKTAYAKMLSTMLKAPIYRAFRRPGAEHHTDDVPRMEELGLPVNTYVEDFYMADFARIIDHEVILDRSLPSAIAYDIVEVQGTLPCHWVDLVSEWDRLLTFARRPVLVVHLVAPYHIAKERMSGYQPGLEECVELNEWISTVIDCLNIPQMELDTSKMKVPEGASLIKAKMRRCANKHQAAQGLAEGQKC